jgi:hypothetical protein
MDMQPGLEYRKADIQQKPTYRKSPVPEIDPGAQPEHAEFPVI